MKPALYAFLITLMAISCHKGAPELAGVPLTDYYNRCSIDEYNFGEMITIGDPNDKFMVTLPYEWEIQETYTDTLYGMIATNSPLAANDPDNFLMISFTGYQTEDSLLNYFKKEIAALKNDKAMKVLEAGVMDFSGADSYWVKFENIQNSQPVMNVVKYLHAPIKGEIYMIHSAVSKSGNVDEKIAILKKLADSFELVK